MECFLQTIFFSLDLNSIEFKSSSKDGIQPYLRLNLRVYFYS